MTETIKTLLQPIQSRRIVAAAPADVARLLAAVQAVDSLIDEFEEEAGVLGLNLQDDDFDRGWYGARRDAVHQIRAAIESALTEAR